MKIGKIGKICLIVAIVLVIAAGMSVSAEKSSAKSSTTSEVTTPTSQSMWVHGNVVQAEYPSRIIQTNRRGFGTTFVAKNNTFNWFQIPITTPVIVDWTRLPLKRIAILYKTDGNAKITNIHIYDGKTKIKSFDGLSLSGDHSNFPLDTFNSWTINPPVTLGAGINIAVRVEFGPKDSIGSPYPSIEFITAGIDQYS